jgi:hypothetical protein
MKEKVVTFKVELECSIVVESDLLPDVIFYFVQDVMNEHKFKAEKVVPYRGAGFDIDVDNVAYIPGTTDVRRG